MGTTRGWKVSCLDSLEVKSLEMKQFRLQMSDIAWGLEFRAVFGEFRSGVQGFGFQVLGRYSIKRCIVNSIPKG